MPLILPATAPRRFENTFAPTAAMLPPRFEVREGQPGSKAGAPVSTRFSTASVFGSGDAEDPPITVRSVRRAAATHGLLRSARSALLPAEPACTSRFTYPELRTSSAQSEPCFRAAASVVDGM